MKKRGEITVFLSLIIICILSLILGLLESARTTGARLYAQMAADSAMASVMSQYNRNLWDMYHLLFLETGSEEAVKESFLEYMEFYLEQENLYPMELKSVKVSQMNGMAEDGGAWLEDGALSYVKYRLPNVADDLAGITEDAANASKAGDFRELFEVCRQTGKKTRKLESSRRKIENSLENMREQLQELMDAADSESRNRVETQAEELVEEMGGFSVLVEKYEAELTRISNHREELLEEAGPGRGEIVWDLEAGNDVDGESSLQAVSAHLSQELLAYEQVEEAAKEQLKQYREMEQVIEQNLDLLDKAIELLEEEPGDFGDEMELVSLGPDWDGIAGVISQIKIPGESQDGNIDLEKVLLLDKLENLFQGDLLKLVLPDSTEVSKQSISLRGVPSRSRERGRPGSKEVYSWDSEKENESESGSDLDVSNAGAVINGLAEASVKKLLVNEYCFLSFDSFLEKCSRKLEVEGQPLLYEQEYLLCGETSDRDNLSETVEKLLTVRGAMNLLHLLSSSEKQVEAEMLAMAVSGGFAPVKLIMTFFILTVWAFGEAVLDVKRLMDGGSVPFWKEDDHWELELEELLAFRFLEPVTEKSEEGSNYKDHMRVLFFLMDREERNYRMMDVIQWNIRTVQEDFAVFDCKCRIELETSILERHLFLMRNTYARTVKTTGAY